MSTEKRDWTYIAKCRCQVTFLTEEDYRKPRTTPSEACTQHTLDQTVARIALVKRAKAALQEWLKAPLQEWLDRLEFHPCPHTVLTADAG